MQTALRRDEGFTQDQVAAVVGVTQARIHQYDSSFRKHLDELQLQLMLASATGEVLGLIVPNQHMADRQVALDYFDLVVKKLRERHIAVKVRHVPTVNGSVFFLEEA